MKPYLLFRVDNENREEYEVAKDIWGDRLTRFRSEIPEDTLVIGRYSCLPFYKDLEDELHNKGSRLINSHQDHLFIAEMDWYHWLEGLTPRTWFDVGYATVPDAEHGWVVKGRTNSRKFKWSTHMYAPNREALRDVMTRLWDDTFIGEQGLVVREYIPLRKLEEGINGMPVTNEWRCFFLGTELLSAGYYWSQAECAEDMTDFPKEAEELAREAASKLASEVPAFVVDVGETEEGGWTIIEINDFQMSGLSLNDPSLFYQKLKAHFESRR